MQFCKVVAVIMLVLIVSPSSGWRRRRRRRTRRSPPPCSPRNCQVSGWSGFSACTHQCGTAGTMTRTRRKTVVEACRGSCPYHFSESRACNRNACRNGGVPRVGYCSCKAGYTGTCCELDVNECVTQRPCQHRCTNTYGSYTCQCNACYTKLGTRCDLRQCLIGGRCYPYGTKNPSNACQDCQTRNKLAWTNNNALKCSDGKACTRADHCSNGRCVGTPFTCLSCEQCVADTCKVKPGFCVITVNGKKTCFSNKALRPGHPCQQCDSNTPHQWTNNNALPCSDGNLKTKNDRCSSGACKGTPYTCLPCERHDGSGCPLNSGHCIIQHGGRRTCFANQQLKPGNPCQWCYPSSSTSAWSNRNGISCDDGNKCTRADTCKNGICTSTPFKCNSHCQVCNGNSCSQKPGFGFVAGKCTCKISGKDYNHQVINPANQCQCCDLYDASTKSSGSWTNRPSVACNDGNACTKKDTCNGGRCVGVAYSCQSSYPSSSCIKTSLCVGDGTCRYVYRAAGTICSPAKDGCDRPEKCNGRLGACPATVTDAITLKTGSVVLKNSAFASAVAFQYTTNALYLSISGFTVSCGQMKFKWYLLDGAASCTTSTSTKGILPNTNTKQSITRLNLLDNKRYKIAIQAVDMRNAARRLVCSSSVTIDTTRPSGGWVRDGTAADVSYQSTKLVSANWGGFNSRHGVGRYEWKVLYTRYGGSSTSELLSFTNVALNTRASRTFNGITDGSTIKVTVRVYTKAGLYTDRASNGVVVDTSRPTEGAVYDGKQAGRDLKYAAWTNTFDANWNAFSDPHSGILKYQWAIKRAGSSLITSYKNLGLGRSDMFTGVRLVSGQRYCAVVRGYNKAGLYVEGTSNCILIDHDKPRAGVVNDGAGSDVQHQSNGSVISANWNRFSDGAQGSGIVDYQYKITDAKNTQIVGLTSVGLRTSMRHSGLALKNGMKYFVTVRAVDAVGWTNEVKSNGVVVDTSRPVFTGTVKVTGSSGAYNGKPGVYVTSATTLQVSWVGFTDGHSGLHHYSWAVIPSSRPVQNSDFKLVGGSLPTQASFSGLSLTPGSSYYVIIRAFNRAFLYTDASSVLIIPDPSPPQPGRVLDGPTKNSDIDYQSSLVFVNATWTPFPEPHTRVKQYFYAIGSCIQGNYHVTSNKFLPVNPPTAISIVYKNVRLVNGQKYCTKVKATNMAGLYSKEVTSDGFIADITPPDIRNARVIDGLRGTDIDYQHSLSEMAASWEGVVDPESGIKNYEYGISRNRGGAPDVFSFRNVGLSTSARATGLNLTEDVYYFIVCAINKAGLRKCLSSDGVLIDHSPPQQGVVNDGRLEPDIKYQASLTSIAANWEGIWDLESGIETFQWAVKENTTGKVAMDYTNVGLATHVQSGEPLQLVSGKTYKIYLKYNNTAGALREIVSNGVTVDGTPPNPSQILPGAAGATDWNYKASEKTYYSSSSSQITAHWNPFIENESQIWFYKWAVGTSKCGAQVQPLTNIGSLTSANTTKSDLSFKYGTNYYVTVTSRNRANLVSRSCSNAFVLDESPPISGLVYAGPGKEHQKYARQDSITVNWKNFVDFESSIDYCDVFADILANSQKIARVPDAASGQIIVPRDRLNPSQSHRIAVQCYNKAGLSSIAWSPVFTIDNSTPVANGPILVGVSRDSGRQYQSRTDAVTITWRQFTDPESPITEYLVSMGTTALRDDIIKFQSVALATQVVFKDLKLDHNRLYYVTLTAQNAAGLNTTVAALPLLVDKTPPQGNQNAVKDGKEGDDVEFIAFNETVAAHWEEITDTESGISRSKYCLGTTPFGCQLKGPTDIGSALRFSCPSCKVNSGERIFVTVEITNRAGLSITRTSNGMLVDGTLPIIGDVMDGDHADGVDMKTALRDWELAAMWGGVEDKESGIKWCWWRIENERKEIMFSSNLTGPFKLEGKNKLTSKHTYASLNFSLGIYFSVITCENKASLRSMTRSNGFRVVSKWPSPAAVRDGSFDLDLDYMTSNNLVSANWNKFQADSRDPVVDYAWAVGTAAGKDDISKFQSVGLNTRVENIQLNDDPDFETLKPGHKHFITVKGTAASGLSSMSSSDGFTVDLTPPIKSVVQVSFRVTNQQRKAVDVNVSWDGVQDKESGILESKYCISTTTGSCKSNRVFSAENATSAVIPNFSPLSMVNYYVIVIVQNKALLSTVMTSQGFQIDTSPPSVGEVIDGPGRDIDFASDTSAMTSQWLGFIDRESGIKNCTWSLIEQSVSSDGSSFGNDTVVFERSVRAYGKETQSGLSLKPGSRYINHISCENKDGFITTSSSDGVIIDISPPVVAKVTDGSDITHDIDFVSMETKVQAVWQEFSDQESGIVGYRWALGTSAGKDDVIAFQGVGRSTRASATNVSLVSGGHYYVTVEASNGAGLTAEGWSDGFIVDDTPPEILQLTNGGQQWLGNAAKLSASWKSRDLQSGIIKSEYCVGTSPPSCQIQPMRELPANASSVTCQDCLLEELVTYYVTVRVWNAAGLYTVGSTSGSTVDLTPPTAGLVTPDVPVTSCVTNCTLSTTVGLFVDRESGISSCRFAIKNNAGFVAPMKSFTPGTAARATGLTLISGQRYFTVVSCADNAGQSTQAKSQSGVLVDVTPPTKGRVIVSPDRTHDVYGVHSSCHLYKSTMRLHWHGFQDPESGLTGFRVAMGTNTNSTNVLPFTNIGIATSYEVNLSSNVFSGDIVYAFVEAQNGAGLVTRAISPPTRLVSADEQEYLEEGDFSCLNF